MASHIPPLGPPTHFRPGVQLDSSGWVMDQPFTLRGTRLVPTISDCGGRHGFPDDWGIVVRARRGVLVYLLSSALVLVGLAPADAHNAAGSFLATRRGGSWRPLLRRAGPQSDGTYTGIEVKIGSAGLSPSQWAFDDAIRACRRALAKLNGQWIYVSRVDLVNVT